MATTVFELHGTRELADSREVQELKLATVFTTAIREFLTNNELLQELIRMDAAEAICDQKEDIQTVITKNLGNREIRTIINVIATKACNSFAVSWSNSINKINLKKRVIKKITKRAKTRKARIIIMKKHIVMKSVKQHGIIRIRRYRKKNFTNANVL